MHESQGLERRETDLEWWVPICTYTGRDGKNEGTELLGWRKDKVTQVHLAWLFEKKDQAENPPIIPTSIRTAAARDRPDQTRPDQTTHQHLSGHVCPRTPRSPRSSAVGTRSAG